MKVLTGNRLEDGEVVFLSAAGWSERFGEATAFADDDEAAEAAEAHAKTEITRIVDPYLIEVSPAADGFAPVSYRERLRALGPTNKTEHGKQALGGADIERILHAEGAARSKGRVALIKRK